MNQNRRTITRRLATGLALYALAIFAHGGLEHVKGTIAKVSDTVVTVAKPDGKTVEVAVNAKTTFSRAGQAIKIRDLKPGERVVIHAEKSANGLIAHTVETGHGTTQH
jgi:hypothetical protein